MKFINRKGSTLALTLIIFAVLMIFATFILSFMVTENKQAMYYQNKTQAYYIAKSGAEAVVETIINELTYEEKLLLIEMEESAIKGGTIISPLIGEIPLSIKKNKDNIEIISTGSSNEVTETVTFVMGIKSDNSVEIDKSFIVITKKEDSENHTPDYLVVNEDIIFGANEEKYKPYNFSNLKYDINSDSMYLDNWSVLGVDNPYVVGWLS